MKGRLLFFAACFCVATAQVFAANASKFASPPEITLKYMPGKYYEYKAQLAVKDKKFADALEQFQKAGFWADKVAQYNVGMLYLNGADGVPVDTIRAVAWLGIAAEQHADYADQALQSAYAQLPAEKRAEASKLFTELNADYGDKVALPRAVKRFNSQMIADKGTHLGIPEEYIVVIESPRPDGNKDQVTIRGNEATIGQGKVTNGSQYFGRIRSEFDEYIETQFGHVVVGAPEPQKATVPPSH